MEMSFTLHVLPGRFAICRLPPETPPPLWGAGAIVSYTRTHTEVSVVCSEDSVPAGIQQDSGWTCLEVSGPLALTMTGVIASLTKSLQDAEVSVFVISTYDTDYLLVKQTRLQAATAALTANGHTVHVRDG